MGQSASFFLARSLWTQCGRESSNIMQIEEINVTDLKYVAFPDLKSTFRAHA